MYIHSWIYHKKQRDGCRLSSDFSYLNWWWQSNNTGHIIAVVAQDVFTVISWQILLCKCHLVKRGTESNKPGTQLWCELCGSKYVPHLCRMLSLGPDVSLVIFVMSEPDLCRRNKWRQLTLGIWSSVFILSVWAKNNLRATLYIATQSHELRW